MLELYTNIRKRRTELGMSQQELAEAVGYKGKSMISQVEKGLVDLPESMIIKFADALSTTPSALMGWESTDLDSHYVDLDEFFKTDSDGIKNDPNKIKEAMEFLDQFEKASPEIQAAILTLLKAQQSQP